MQRPTPLFIGLLIESSVKTYLYAGRDGGNELPKGDTKKHHYDCDLLLVRRSIKGT